MGLGRVLVLSASAGAGHLRAAEAVEREIQRTGAASVVEHVDVLKYTNKIFRHFYSQAYLDLVNHAPEVLGWFYDYLDRPWKNERIRLAFDRLNTGPLVRMFEKFRPDIAICTHFLPSEIISSLRREGRVTFGNVVVVTDMDVHAMWLCRDFDHYCVAMEETKVHLERIGLPPAQVTVTGIPIDPVFSEPRDRQALLVKHGLLPDRTNILVSAGGFGVGPIQHLVAAIEKMEHPAQVLVICGRNEELRLELASRAPKVGGVRLVPLGFTKEMDEFMSVADIFVGKPGGLTTSELMAKGVPMMIVNPIPGQEERNSDHLLEEGAAMRCNNLPVLGYKLDRLLDDAPRLARLRERARAIGKPGAAAAVVDVARQVMSRRR